MTRLQHYGETRPVVRNPYSHARRGKRLDLGNIFFRSRWEANYARYLRFLVEHGSIATWRYEPKVFVFPGITRGVMSYLPDFEVTENDGQIVYHEVKGWMDKKSQTRLRRMAKFFPDIKVFVIGGTEYRSITQWSRLIDGWEDDEPRIALNGSTEPIVQPRLGIRFS